MTATLLTNTHIAIGEPGSMATSTLPSQDILVTDGVLTTFGPGLAQQHEVQGGDLAAIRVVDLGGKLVCPPFYDTHLHLDYILMARKSDAANESGALLEGIQQRSETKPDLTIDETKQRVRIDVRGETLHGVQLIQSYTDMTGPNLTSLKALLKLKEELKDTVTLQIVSLPQEGMYSYEDPHGESGAELVEEEFKTGVDCVGGIPHFEQYCKLGKHSVHTAVKLALKYDRLVNVHCGETDDSNFCHVELLPVLVYKAGIGPKVTANYTCSLESADSIYSFHLTKLLKTVYTNFVCAPTENLHLQGHQDISPKRRDITRIRELTEAGVNVSLSQDSIQDPRHPLDDGSIMLTLDYMPHLAQMMGFEGIDDALKFLTVNGATILSLRDVYGSETGKPASSIVLDADSVFNVAHERYSVLCSAHAGRVLFIHEKIIDTGLVLL